MAFQRHFQDEGEGDQSDGVVEGTQMAKIPVKRSMINAAFPVKLMMVNPSFVLLYYQKNFG